MITIDQRQPSAGPAAPQVGFRTVKVVEAAVALAQLARLTGLRFDGAAA